MKFDFTSILKRKGMDALALDAIGQMEGFAPSAPQNDIDVIPMWVADMNFPVCPAIPLEIIKRVKEPHYGYFMPRDEYYETIINWHQKRNQVIGLKKEHIGYENGVLGGVVSALNVFCSKGDNVLVHSPTYIGFTNCLTNNGYHIIHSPLSLDADGIWRMNFEDMEEKLKNQKIHAAIFCSPHNPCGRVWEEWEIEKFIALCRKYDVFVVSDEIWSDIILAGNKHIPTQSINDDARMRTVALYAPSKTFNLAGLVGSYHIVYNQWICDRLEKECSLSHYNEMNLLSMYAQIGAYSSSGHEWTDELCQVLTENIEYAYEFVTQQFTGVLTSKPQGTYLMFLDCSQWCMEHGKTIEYVENAAWKVGVAVQDGAMFHGPCHLRMNLALPKSQIQRAMERLDKYVFHAD